MGKERVQAVSTEDILVHGKREVRIKHCRGRLGANQKVCPALDECHHSQRSSAGVIVETGESGSVGIFSTKAMPGPREEHVFVTSRTHVQPRSLRQHVRRETPAFPEGSGND